MATSVFDQSAIGELVSASSSAAVPQSARPTPSLVRLVEKYRRLFVIATHLCLVVVSNYFAFSLRFDGRIPGDEVARLLRALPWLIAIRGALFLRFRLYSGSWRYTSISDLSNIVMAVATSTVAFAGVVTYVPGLGAYSRSVLVLDAILLTGALSGIRIATRVVRELPRARGTRRVLIFGAGDAGEMIVRDMRNHPSGYRPIGFIDDNPAKTGQRIHGLPVLGTRRDLPRVIVTHTPHEVLVAMPSADPAIVREVVGLLQPFKVPITTLPGLSDILDGRVSVNHIRDLTIEDLLPRTPIDLDVEPVRALITGARVMVTGAGGSIGAELCRQIAVLQPAQLVLYERYENALYAITNDLAGRFGSLSILSIIGDVTDEMRVRQVLDLYRPQIIFHAAAHKHVPLMEHNPCEAVKNNIVGTATVARAADKYGVERFIMISTDKAVNPSSVMGATKRVGELLVQQMSRCSATRFAIVRFGNVLGSNGSVIPRFIDQIKAGGPVTVTHPEIRRFFMLIPEAVQLVLHAAALGEPGMVYVLDMGEQIKVLDVARNVIRLAGFVPEQEIPITFVGLRPGEKLFEELVACDETAEPTSVPKILRVRPAQCGANEVLEAGVAEIVRFAVRGDALRVVEQLRRLSPTFEPVSHDHQAAAGEAHEGRLIAATPAAEVLTQQAGQPQPQRMRVA
jgi:FlaA1/EpsC-like NDP-sugar epimerase